MDRSEAERGAAQPPKTRPRWRESERASWPFRSVTASSAKGARSLTGGLSRLRLGRRWTVPTGDQRPLRTPVFTRELCTRVGRTPAGARCVRRGAPFNPLPLVGGIAKRVGSTDCAWGSGTYGLWVVLGVHNGQGPVRLTEGETLLQPGGDGHRAVLLHQNQFKSPFLPMAAPEADGFLPAHDK